MRITRIHLKNLNSLLGEWSINLDLPEYADEGIFAVTGPTGAGKSTLLDAICLALYGQTPRLGRLSASFNDIMSRRAGECSAEVEFELASGRYRCTWYQHRARRRAGGTLQPYTHQIADITKDPEHGEILENAPSKTAAKVTELTGLDFDRFTRSMLLAQGRFATFLNASPSERSPILEQITGTDIYTHISKSAHTRLNREKAWHEELKAKLAGLQVLAPEEEAELRARRRAAADQDAALAREEEEVRRMLRRMEQKGEVRAQLAALEQKERDCAAREQAFLPSRLRLACALRALELDSGYTELTSLREQKRSAEAALQEQEEQQNRLNDALRDARAQHESALANEASARNERERALPLLRAVRDMDVRLAEKREQVTRLVQEAEAARRQREEHAREQDACLSLGRKLAEEKDRLERELATGSEDDALPEALPLLRERLTALGARQKESRTADEELANARNARQRADRETARQKDEVARLTRQDSAARHAAEQEDAALAALLNGASPEAVRSELAILRARAHTFATLRDHAARRDAALRLQEEKEQEGERLAATLAAMTETLRLLRDKETLLAADEAVCQEKISMAARVASLAEQRAELHDGLPCPLCGAVHHPYAAGILPREDEARNSLRAVQAELARVRAEVLDKEKRCSAALRDQANLAALAADNAKRAAEEDALVAEHAARADLHADLFRTADNGAELQRVQAELDAALNRAEQRNRELSATEERCRDLRRAVQETGDALTSARVDAERSEGTAALIRAAEERAEQNAQERNSARDSAERAWRDALTPFTLATDLTDAEILRTLEARRERRERLRDEARALDRELEKQSAAREKREEQLRADEQTLRSASQKLAEAGDEQRALETRRRETLHALDGDASGADEAEARREHALRTAENAVRQAIQTKEGTERAKEAASARLREGEQRLKELNAMLQEREPDFAALLCRKGFARENNSESPQEAERVFLASRLAEEERERLRREEQALDEEKTSLASQREVLTARYAALDDAMPAPLAVPGAAGQTAENAARDEQQKDAFSARLNDVLSARTALQREIGILDQRLEADARLVREWGEKSRALHRQEAECRRWQDLHDLIGSYDGARFRNFAQGLTFDAVITLANRQLARMTDRYTLLRMPAADGEGASLELAVKDHWQAGEVRTTKNLSGGESFLVSLALALGLSRLAGRKIRVDSLFLDEGFGTLDAEALDVALDTLGALRQDGKIIGVISHVAALRDRIGTRIELTRGTGGVSALHGPGCKRIDA